MHLAPVLHFAIVAIVWSAVSAAAGDLRTLLAPDLAVPPGDSIVELAPGRDGAITVRTITASGGATVRRFQAMRDRQERILDEARKQGLVPGSPTPRASDSVLSAGIGSAPSPPPLQAKNRRNFLEGGTGFGFAILSAGALPIFPPEGPFDERVRHVLGTMAISLPVSGIGHYLYGWNREWTDAHVEGTTYGGLAAWTIGALTPMALDGVEWENFGTGMTAGAIAYPLGIHLGYRYGGTHRDNPGRVALVSALARVGLAAGVLAPLAIGGRRGRTDPSLRLGMATGLAGATGGHVLGAFYRPGQKIPSGLGGGTYSLATLGGLAGLQAAALLHPSDPRAYFGSILAGELAGAGLGMTLLPLRRDTRQRSTYLAAAATLGMFSGQTSWVFLADEIPMNMSTFATFSSAGAFGSYFIATLLTMDLVEPATRASTRSDRIAAVDIDPIPRLALRQSPAGRDLAWQIAGVVLSLR